MKRIILQQLKLTGINKKDAILDFEPGLNIITGDSDTGKTFAFQCLDYIFGASTIPKEIEESKGYQFISLRFKIGGQSYFLERNIGCASASIVYDGKQEELSCKHDAANLKNLSRFLLSRILESDENIFLVKNKSNVKRTLSFRDLIHLCMVDETEIITEKSAFQSEQNIDKTVRTSVFKYIITGEDDLSALAREDVDEENTKRAGVVNFLKSKKESLENKIQEIESDKNFKLYSNSKTLAEIGVKINEIRVHISRNNASIEVKRNRVLQLKKICFEDELKITDFEHVDEYYLKEIQKYGTMNTYADFLLQVPTLNCPVCGKTFEDSDCISEGDLNDLFEYFKSQVNEFLIKEKDVKNAIFDVETRLRDNKNEIKRLESEIEEIKLSTAELETTLKEYNQNIVILRKLDSMNKALDIYRQELMSVEGDIIAYAEKVKAPKIQKRTINASVFSEYCQEVKETLKQWGFNKNADVTFDYETLDFEIGNKKRTCWGKGYRAFFMSAMTIALMRFCNKYNQPHAGFVVLDSPLVSLKERKKDTKGEWIEDYMERMMIENISKVDKNNQVIIFENKNLNYGQDGVYIEFNHVGNSRKGFIPS